MCRLDEKLLNSSATGKLIHDAYITLTTTRPHHPRAPVGNQPRTCSRILSKERISLLWNHSRSASEILPYSVSGKP